MPSHPLYSFLNSGVAVPGTDSGSPSFVLGWFPAIWQVPRRYILLAYGVWPSVFELAQWGSQESKGNPAHMLFPFLTPFCCGFSGEK